MSDSVQPKRQRLHSTETLVGLVEMSRSISFETSVQRVAELVRMCKLSNDPSLPNINKYPILCLIHRLGVDIEKLPEDPDLFDDNIPSRHPESISFGAALDDRSKNLPVGISKTLWVIRIVAENSCGIDIHGEPIHMSEVASAMRESGRTPDEMGVIPFLGAVCSSLHVVGASTCREKEAEGYDSYLAKICRRLPPVADLLDPPLMFPLAPTGVVLPPLAFGNLPVGPNNMQISAVPQILTAPAAATGFVAAGAPYVNGGVFILGAARDIGAVSTSIRIQAPNVCVARVSTNGNLVWQ